MRPSLEGVRGKIQRAKDHLSDFQRVCREATYAESGQTVLIQDETQGAVLQGNFPKVNDLPLQARLLIGDVVHALASALDHLIYQLSLLETQDAKACDDHKTHFPIFATCSREDLKTIDKRLKLMSPAAADLIRSFQPYVRRPSDPFSDPLWILFKLDVIDKHRLVLITDIAVSVRQVTLSLPNESPDVIDVPEPRWQRFEPSAKLFQFVLPPGVVPHPELHIHVKAAVRILFAETGLSCDGHEVIDVLPRLIREVETGVVARLSGLFQ